MSNERNTKPEKETFTFSFWSERENRDRYVDIKARNLVEAVDIFEKNFGKNTSFSV